MGADQVRWRSIMLDRFPVKTTVAPDLVPEAEDFATALLMRLRYPPAPSPM